MFARFSADYGMVFVLLLLCGYYSVATWAEQHPTGAAAGEEMAGRIAAKVGSEAQVVIVARDNAEDAAFADTLRDRLAALNRPPVAVVKGQPSDARRALEQIENRGGGLDVIVCTSTTAGWAVFENLGSIFPGFASARVMIPQSYWWPNFLKATNLLNIANQIVVYAVIAIGMTMVIITGGIDLSVGSLVALSAVSATLFIRSMGAESAGSSIMIVGCAVGIVLCGLVGLASGLLITVGGVPAFIVTLAMMLVARGLAFLLAAGQSVYQLPPTFIWLGRGADLFGIPNAVVLTALLYALAHVLMTRMTLGRYIYAVGGNAEAARLSGVPVRSVLLFVYTLCGALAGLGGVITASQLRSGLPTYGDMYELYVIAAVVVGGTSLQGGQGKILGTLIGAFIIAVIQNGMNLTGVESYTQKVVLGAVILGAVLLDQMKKRGWAAWRRPRSKS